MKLSSALGGLAGACTLIVLNESVKNLDKNVPQLDLLGMNAVAKMVKGPSLDYKLKPVSLAGDLVSNSLYFGMANSGDKKSTLICGAMLGLSAGVGAISLANSLGVEDTTTQSAKTKALIITWYIIGGLVAAAVINVFDNKKQLSF